MKKILFVALAIAIPYVHYGQIIQNGDFYQNSGNNQTVGSCPSFSNGTNISNGSIPNWSKTHGSPRIYPLCSQATPNAIMLQDNSGYGGQGLAGGYHFYKNKLYYVWLVLCGMDGTTLPGVVNLKATQNLPAGTINSLNCLAQIPTNAGSTETIAILSNTSAPALANVVPLLFTPQNNSYDYIWVYPQANNISGAQIVVSALYVARGCTDDLYFSANAATGYIQPDPDEGFYYRAYSNIHAGSSFGTSSVPVNVNGTAVTTFEAQRMIELLPNFTATPSGTGYFEAHIDALTCGTAGGYTDLPVPTESGQNVMSNALARKLSEPETEDNAVVNADRFLIYPNPTSSKVTIETPSLSGPISNQVIVSDILGQVLYRTQSEQNKLELDLSNYTSGTYIISVKSADKTKIFKVNKK